MTPTPLRRRLILTAALTASFVAGGLVLSGPVAVAQNMMMEHGGMAGHGDMHAMMAAHVEKMLAAVDATPDQRQRIHAILGRAMGALGPMHEGMKSVHGDLHRLLTAPVIDRGALEQLRASKIADFDRASRVLVNALADAAEVLTPAQRAKLGAMMAEHHHQP